MPTPAEPSALRSAALSLTERCLRLLLAAVSLGFILLFLFTAARRMAYPFSEEQVEGNMLVTVLRLAHGQPIYTRPSPDFVPFLYTPVFYYVALALGKLTGGVTYLTLRLVSTLATLGTFGVLYAFVFGETRKHLPALAAAGFYAACYHPVQGWFDLGRVDSLFVFFFVLAIYCTRRAPILVAVLVWTLAFQTKQGVLPIAMLIFCSEWQRPRRMLLGMGGLVAVLGGSIFALNHATSGWYNYYVFSSTKGLGWLWRQFVFYLPVDFLLPFGLACLLILAALLLAPPSLKGRGAHFFFVTSFAVYAAIWYLRAHNGSAQNTLIPAYAWTAVLFGIAIARLQGWLATQPASTAQVFHILILGAAAGQIAAHIYQPGRYIPIATIRNDHQLFVDQLRALPGDPFVFNHNDDELFAGKPTHAVVDAFGLITQGPRSPQRDALIEEFRQAVETHRYSAIVTDDLFTPEYLQTVPWPTDMLQAYPVRIPVHGNSVGDVTSTQPREKWIYLPCSALNQDLSHVIPSGAAVSYGNCPNAPASTPAPQPASSPTGSR